MKGFYGTLAHMYDNELLAALRAQYAGTNTFGQEVHHLARAQAVCLIASIQEDEPAHRFVATTDGTVTQTVPCMKFDPTGTPVPVSATPIERN
jgi:hypothetical protein